MFGVSTSSLQLKFFVDRSLGKKVPKLLRRAEFDLITLGEYYGEIDGQSVQDETWLQLAGENGWPVLTADDKIRFRKIEKEALINYKAQVFVLPSRKNMKAKDEAERFISHKKDIEKKCEQDGPFAFSVRKDGLAKLEFQKTKTSKKNKKK